ncbi:MAG: tRNA-modifying protein YgfZ [Burkholderiaceae bacterium]|jgi:folate-binding protein YgfZ|nr:MAG: tRNA-modifying protein YgfZ [Burkholderiaceae bacterium]
MPMSAAPLSSVRPGTVAEAPDALLSGIAPLPQLGVISVQGDDGPKFLHGLLSQDFLQLDATHARLAALCSAKGRMQASFIALRRGADEILLVCSRDLLPATLKRLAMFVLRAKVRLSDASDAYALFGIVGDAIDSRANELGEPWAVAAFGDALRVTLYPADGRPRALWIAPAGAAAPPGAALGAGLWDWGEVRSGVATLTAAVVDTFVPQMLNYESVGGVNFHKGCYPGQEVVARSQFRGTLKRRAHLAHCERLLLAGEELFHDSDPSQPCGRVAQAAPAPLGGCDAIVSVQVQAAASGAIRAGASDGAPLTLLPLPYPLLQDV